MGILELPVTAVEDTHADGYACTCVLVAGNQDWLTANCIAMKLTLMNTPLKQNKSAHHRNLAAL